MGSIELDSPAVCLSWHCDSNRLLIGCANGQVQIWSYNPNTTNHFFNDSFKNEMQQRSNTTTSSTSTTATKTAAAAGPVRFSIYDDTDGTTTSSPTKSKMSDSKNRIAEEEGEDDDQPGSSTVPIFSKIWETK